MNAKVIEGLKTIRKGIDLVLEGVEGTPDVIPEVAVPTVSKKTVEEAPAEAVENSLVTREQLDGMTYNDLKKFAKSKGIPAVGNREDITARLLGETPDEEPKPVKKTAPKEVPVDESDNDPIYAKVIEATKDMETEEIADVLADIGISAKGKRETLIDKVVQAVKDGLLDFDDEEDEEDTDTPTTAPAPTPVESDEDDEEDDTNDVDNPNMTEARKEAIIAQDESIRKQFKKGEVTREELVEFLQAFYDTEDDLSDMSDDDILDTYIDAVCRLVDDEGNIVEEGAYMLNGEPACCGRVLAYSEDTNVFICEHCGEEYEAEE